MKLAAVSLVGLLLFLWPFLGGPDPGVAAALAVAVGAALALLLVELGTRELDTRRLALLAALAAVDAGLRLAVVIGIGGFSPFFFLVLCAGYVFGPSYGFLTGAFSLLVSAVATGGVGPWVPYQMFAAGWVGAAAGLVGLWRAGLAGRAELMALAVVGALMGWVFGALMDIQGWVTGFRNSPDLGWLPGMPAALSALHFWRYYLLTSVAYDSFRAGGNALMVILLGAPVVAALGRLRARLTFEVVS